MDYVQSIDVAVLTLLEPSLTNTIATSSIAVLLSHEVCTAIIYTNSQMWVGSGLTSKARGPIYSNLHRDSNGKNHKISLLLLTSVIAHWTDNG